jgi:hypothetical protein
MSIRKEFLKYDIQKRSNYLADQNTLFLNLKGLEAENIQDIEIMKEVIEQKCAEAGGKIKAVAMYAFDIDEELMETYVEMGAYIAKNYHAPVSQFGNREEMRERLGDEFVKRAFDLKM